MEREGGGTRKGAGGCAHPCVRLIYRVYACTCARARTQPRYMSTYTRGSSRERKRERGARVCVRTRGCKRHVEGSGRQGLVLENARAGMDDSEGGFEGDFEAGCEGMSGGRAYTWTPCFVRVSFVGVTARWKLNDACRRRQTSIH